MEFKEERNLIKIDREFYKVERKLNNELKKKKIGKKPQQDMKKMMAFLRDLRNVKLNYWQDSGIYKDWIMQKNVN